MSLASHSSATSPLLAFAERLLSPWVVALLGLYCAAVSVVFNNYGQLHHEMWLYIPVHLSDHSLGSIIFHSKALDSGDYQGRELSYLVDHLDIRIMTLTVGIGFPVFVAASQVLFTWGTGLLIGNFATRDLGLSRLQGALISLLFWTSSFAFIYLMFRSAKVGATFFCTASCIALYRGLRGRKEEATRSGVDARWPWAIWVGVLALIASLFDRQGLFIICGLLVIVMLRAAFLRCRRHFMASCALAAAVLANTIYFLLIGPALMMHFVHYAPDYTLAKLPIVLLLRDVAHYFAEGSNLLLDTLTYTTGNLPTWGGLLLVAAGIAVAFMRDQRASRAHAAHAESERIVPWAYVGTAVLWIFMLWVLQTIMVLRHPPVAWDDVRFFYYGTPTAALFMLGLAFCLREIPRLWTLRPAWLSVPLALMLAGNIVALPHYRETVAEGHLVDTIKFSHWMRESLLKETPGSPQEENPMRTVPLYEQLRAFTPAARAEK